MHAENPARRSGGTRPGIRFFPSRGVTPEGSERADIKAAGRQPCRRQRVGNQVRNSWIAVEEMGCPIILRRHRRLR